MTYPTFSELVPHSGRMVLLDEMLEWEPGKATCRLELRDGAPFVDDGAVDAIVSIEYMAQAVAACLGYEAFVGGDGVRVGMIIASKRFDVHEPTWHVGDVFDVVVERVRGNESLSHFDAEVRRAGSGTVAASALLTLFHAEKPPE